MKNLITYIAVGVVAAVAAVCAITIATKAYQFSTQKKELAKNITDLENNVKSSAQTIGKILDDSIESSNVRKENVKKIKESAKYIYDEYQKSSFMLGLRIFLKSPWTFTKNYVLDADFRKVISSLNSISDKIVNS